jgi:hypothetical protein
MGWEEAESEGREYSPLTKHVIQGLMTCRASRTIASKRIGFPTWLARDKDNGKVPTADREMTVRATPEPAETPCIRVGGQVANV